MTTWHVQLLGGFDIRCNGISLSSAFQTDNARLLFTWLCFHQRQAVRRETLTGLFWPDRPQAAAQNTLRVTLSRIRRALGKASSLLYTSAQTVTLNVPPVWQVDALQFEQIVTTIHSHNHRSILGCRHCQELLQTAETLYQGEFIAGFTPESEPLFDWYTRQREYFHRSFLSVLAQLGEYALRAHDWHSVLTYATRQLEAEPWHESAHRQLMLALARQGQRASALAQYQNCCKILQQELGVEPEPVTQELAVAIREGGLPDDPSYLTSRRQAMALDQLPLVGREQEIQTLTDLINRPDLQLITVVGEGGVGKTRLAIRAAQLMRFAFPDGVCYIFLHPEDGFAANIGLLTLNPVQYLAHCIATTCEIALNERQSTEAQVIAALQNRACLLVFDSFEHVVTASLFLKELLSAATQCVALVTSRQRLYLRQEHVLHLAPLSTTSTAQQVSPGARMFVELARRQGMTFTTADEYCDIDQVCSALSGLPLGIELAVACLNSMNLTTLRQTVFRSVKSLNSPILDVPGRHRSLQAVFESTWNSLSEASRQALAMLSVVNAACPLAAALAITESEQALAELIELSLVHHLAEDRIWLHEYVRQFASEKLAQDFDHANFREVAYRRHAHWFLRWLTSSRSDLRGPQSFEIRENLAANLIDIEAAWHWALVHAEWDLVANAALAYEDLYRLMGRFVAGVERFQQSLAYVTNPITSSAKRLRASLLSGYVSLQRLRSGHQHVFSVTAEALALAEQLADPLLQAMIKCQSGMLNTLAGDHEQGQQEFLQALALLNGPNGTFHDTDALLIIATCLRSLSEIDLRLGNLEAATDFAQRAMAVCQQTHDHLAIARCFETLSNVVSAQGKLEESDHYLRQALDIYQRLRVTYQKTRVLDLLAQNADARGDYALAQRYYFQGLALARESGDRDAEIIARINLGISADFMGNYDQALEHTRLALALSELVSDRRHRTTITANLSLYAHHNQRHNLALSYAQATIEQAQRSGLRELEGYGYDFQGHALLALHHLDEAELSYQKALHIRQQFNNPALVLESQAGLTRVALARHDTTEALRRALPIVDHLLAGGHLNGAEETLRIYWTVYQALMLNADARASAILALGYHLIQERAGRLSDPRQRSIYLNIDVHRQIVATYQAQIGQSDRPMSSHMSVA